MNPQIPKSTPFMSDASFRAECLFFDDGVVAFSSRDRQCARHSVPQGM